MIKFIVKNVILDFGTVTPKSFVLRLPLSFHHDSEEILSFVPGKTPRSKRQLKHVLHSQVDGFYELPGLINLWCRMSSY